MRFRGRSGLCWLDRRQVPEQVLLLFIIESAHEGYSAKRADRDCHKSDEGLAGSWGRH